MGRVEAIVSLVVFGVLVLIALAVDGQAFLTPVFAALGAAVYAAVYVKVEHPRAAYWICILGCLGMMLAVALNGRESDLLVNVAAATLGVWVAYRWLSVHTQRNP